MQCSNKKKTDFKKLKEKEKENTTEKEKLRIVIRTNGSILLPLKCQKELQVCSMCDYLNLEFCNVEHLSA